MEHSDRLSLTYVAAAQAQKHVTVNETTRALDALVHMTVQSRALSTQPPTPLTGEGYILPEGKSGDRWSTFADHAVAVFQDNAWFEYPAVEGMTVYVSDESQHCVWDGSEWQIVSSDGGDNTQAPEFGVNTTADVTNKLSVKSDAVLHSHDDVTPGSGDVRHVLNKASENNTASQLFQTGWSARAEFGLTGSDDFVIKVSPDGQIFYDAIVVDRLTGQVRFPNTPDLSSGPAPIPETSIADPTEISGLVLWYDPNDANALTMDGTGVAQVSDKSGQGNHAIQIASSLQPELSTSVLSGRTMLGFSGGQSMDMDGLASHLAGEDHPFSIHSVYDPEGVTKVILSLTNQALSSPIMWFGISNTNNLRVTRQGIDVVPLDVDLHPNDGGLHVVSVVYNGVDLDVWLDGVKMYEGLPMNTAAADFQEATLGALKLNGNPSFGFIGQLGELAIFDRSNTDAEIRQMQRYLVTRWLGLAPEADLFLAGGQSNMQGIGDANGSPSVAPGHGFMFQNSGLFAYTDDPVGEGVYEAEDGSLIPSFSNTWYNQTGRTALIVPKGAGGSGLLPGANIGFGTWDKDSGAIYSDAVSSFNEAIQVVREETAFILKGVYVLWQQGESDAIALNHNASGVSAEAYRSALQSLVINFNMDIDGGIDQFFMIEMGLRSGDPNNTSWDAIRAEQTNAMNNISIAHMVSTSAKTFHTTGRMQGDGLHWNQQGLNDIGVEAATNAASIIGS